ncbi:MAG: (2Fe-2S)-binding protein [Gammaproteobacteria bacterium]|nr:MAG: (2Fe-2S)-binding protein [Gammaproteobacteria bacterium]
MFKQFQDSDTEIVEVILSGQVVKVPVGTSVAAMALTQGVGSTRTTSVSGSKRAPFCMMGVCYDCLMVIDGKANQRACSIVVKQGMTVDIQHGAGPKLEKG